MIPLGMTEILIFGMVAEQLKMYMEKYLAHGCHSQEVVVVHILDKKQLRKAHAVLLPSQLEGR
jgi:hypothetical protein